MRTKEMMENAENELWCLHLSFIQPHWPIVVPAPYHDLYSQKDFLPANRSEPELSHTHPIFEAYMTHNDSQTFTKNTVRDYVMSAYVGLIKQNDQLGDLFAFMQSKGLMDNTMIVFTSDHGDYFGDHYLGEKDFSMIVVLKSP